MDKKEIEQILVGQREEYQRYLGVALAEQDLRLKPIMDQLLAIRNSTQ